jgi:hypothetical protein
MLVVGSLKRMDGCMSSRLRETRGIMIKGNGIFPKWQFVDGRRQNQTANLDKLIKSMQPRPDQTITLEIIIVHNGS